MPSILVVEDDNFFREVISGVMRRKGYFIDTAVDGKEAVEKMLNSRYDLMITDVFMDNIDGIQAISVAKSISPQTQIIVVTGNNSIEIERQVRAFGVLYYLIKPFEMKELKEAVESAMKAGAPKNCEN